MGHATIYTLLTGKTPKIFIFKDFYGGATAINEEFYTLSDWARTALLVAGPMANVAFSYGKLFSAEALKNHLPWPTTLSLRLGAIYQIYLELSYAYNSLHAGFGDFGLIAEIGNTHLTVAATTLLVQVSLGLLTIYYIN
jgi:hypothetical protein